MSTVKVSEELINKGLLEASKELKKSKSCYLAKLRECRNSLRNRKENLLTHKRAVKRISMRLGEIEASNDDLVID